MQHSLRILLASLAVGVVFSAAVAVTPAHAIRPTINPQAGITWTNLTSTDDLDITDKGRLGYALGGQARFGGRVYIAPGLFYQRTALEASLIDTVGVGDITDVVGTNAFYIPVHFGINLSPSPGQAGLRLYAGPSVTVVTSVGDNEFGAEKDDYESTIFGGVLGAGVDVSSLTLDLNYEVGLSTVLKADDKAKQNVLRALIGFRY
jgi:hypothetical protein